MIKHWKTALILVAIGLLLSLSRHSTPSTDKAIELTENNHVLFSGVVTDESVAKVQIKLSQLSAEMSNNDVIYLVIESPGGSVTAGNRFVDFASSLPQKVKTICLFCASMGYHIFESLDERLVYSSSELMSHRVSIGGLAGQVPGEAVSRLKDIIATSQKMDEKVAKRIGITVEEYQKSIYDELWLNGEDAVKLKHADRVAKIKCSADLVNEIRAETINTFLGPVDVTRSSCPLISGFLSIKFGKEFRSKQEAMNEVKKAERKFTVEY